MIVARQKDLTEIQEMIAPYKRVLIVGCGTCMTICSAGGPDEVKRLASDLISARPDLILDNTMIPRQCSAKFLDRIAENVGCCEAVISMGCGNGVQSVAIHFPDKCVFPALDTQFIGVEGEAGIWTEMCSACGDCILGRTAAVCPVTRCSKGLLNGPCGGAQQGKCEVSKDIPCAWQEIYHRLKRLGLLSLLEEGVKAHNRPVHPRRLVSKGLGTDQQT